MERIKRRLSRLLPFSTLAILGPGIIAAASGNDAGGIATYSTIGAQFGYKFLWLLFLILVPALATVQMMSIRLGVVTGKGLCALIRERFNIRSAMFGIAALFIANSLTAMSEFFGIAAALELFEVPKEIGVPIAALTVWFLIVKGTYQRVEKLFLLLSAVFLCYIGASILARPAWDEAARSMITPSIELTPPFLALFIATIATTITPYMQIFAQSSVVEKGVSVKELPVAQLDATLGSIFSSTIAIFIVITTAATLFQHGIRIETAADAALSLQPLVGQYASMLFGAGLFGASMLAAGVLPLTTAFSTCEAFGWRAGIRYSYKQAPIFYSIFTLLIIFGAIVSLIPGIPLFQLLIFAYLLNGFFLPVELFFMLKLANDRELMGTHVNSPLLNIMAIVVLLLVTTAIILLFLSSLPLAQLLTF